jgi:hypothetical protein
MRRSALDTAGFTKQESPMPSVTFSKAAFSPLARTVAVTALMSAALLAGPVIAARADSATGAPIQLADNSAGAHDHSGKTEAAKAATSTKGESVEDRITYLHAALKITPDEDASWNAVAQTMRDNAACVEKLIAQKKTQAPQGMTAIDDLKTYSEFAQAHVDGLKNLTSSFATLYAAMPDQQKQIADQVFRDRGSSAHAAAHKHQG